MNRKRKYSPRKSLIFTCVSLVYSLGSLQAQDSPWTAWQTAVESFQEGKTEEAGRHFLQAASLWEDSQDFNAGTAWALGGRSAPAVRSFHRALEKDPFHWDAAYNLEHLRKEAELEAPVWNPSLKPLITTLAALLSSLLISAAFLLWAKKAGKAPSVPVLFLLAAGVVAGALAAAVEIRADVRILGQETVPRLGDGEYYRTVGNGPWKPGQEVLVVQVREGWVRAKTASRDGWVPEAVLLKP